jgi:hypothetical protein
MAWMCVFIGTYHGLHVWSVCMFRNHAAFM